MNETVHNQLTLRGVFINPQENRLRAGWRLLVNFFLFLFASFIVAIPFLVLVYVFPNLENTWLILATGVPMVLSVVVSRLLLDRRSVGSLGLPLNLRAGLDVLAGFAIAAVMLLLVFVVELAMGWLALDGFGWQEAGLLSMLGSVLLWLVLFAAVGFYEELFSRGYQLQNLEEGLNTFWAVVLSAGFFGLLHLSNPGASLVSTVGIALAGLFFAFGYLRTRTLWLVIGLHAGWNFILGPVLGFPVSGMVMPSVLRLAVSGPEIWTGGVFGPEAGLVVLPAFVLGAGLVWLYSRWRVGDKHEDETTNEIKNK